MGKPIDHAEGSAITTLENRLDYSQMAHLFKGADIKDYRTPFDTGSTYCPQLDIYSGAQPVDGFKTDKGRTFQFDKDGNARYRVTSKDFRGLNDIVTDYMTTRDGRKPTAQQVQQMVDKMVKDPSNRISDVNNIRVGQDLRFPGPERAQRVPDSPYAPGRPIDQQQRVPTQRDTYPGWERKPPEKTPDSPIVQPPGTKDSRDGSRPEGVKDLKVGQTRDNRDGTRTTDYKGELDDGYPGGWLVGGVGRTEFTASDRKDSQGRLIERKVEYDSEIKIKIRDDKGQDIEVKVNKVETKWNPATNSYDTVLSGKDGKQYFIRTGPDGKQITR